MWTFYYIYKNTLPEENEMSAQTLINFDKYKIPLNELLAKLWLYNSASF